MLLRNPPDRIRIAFDDRRLVANAGLLLPATLTQHLGLPQMVQKHLDLGDGPDRASGTGGRTDWKYPTGFSPHCKCRSHLGFSLVRRYRKSVKEGNVPHNRNGWTLHLAVGFVDRSDGLHHA